LDRKFGGFQSWFGRGSEQKKSQPLPGLEQPIVQPVTQRYTTELSQTKKCSRKFCTGLQSVMYFGPCHQIEGHKKKVIFLNLLKWTEKKKENSHYVSFNFGIIK
jgi:hypothetical protein